MSFQNIPHEMRAYKQWVVWRLEIREGAKPTKVPYSPWPNGGKAKVSDGNKGGTPAIETWGTFEQACSAPFTCIEPCDSSLPVSQTGFSGIGFVFTKDDPFGFIDLDDTHGNVEAYQTQQRIFQKFQSYSELSPSGKGLHIIIKATIPHGRRRADVELYTNERYATMTGNVFLNAPIEERQELADILFNQLGGPAIAYTDVQDQPQEHSDEDILAMARTALNGEKFNLLYEGLWTGLYSSQSEADFALVDMIGFYSHNTQQIARIFRASALGQRDKALRDDYVGYMVRKAFDRQLPPVDLEGLTIALNNARAVEAAKEPGGTFAASSQTGPEPRCQVDPQLPAIVGNVNKFPPGMLGEIAQFILDAAPRPVPEIALAGAIALLSGICGRAYNVSGTGLNQYILMLAPTGRGKDAIAAGVNKLMEAVCKTVPSAGDFRGPGEMVSSAGLIKWLDRKPAVLSILGEFGVKLKEMSNPNANPHISGLERVLLQLYSKSGQGNVFDPMAYSDKEKNTSAIVSPSLSIIGESVPERFYAMLDDTMIASGLLPRFLMFEYKGARHYLKEDTQNVVPSFNLVQGLADLCTTSLTYSHNGNVHNVPMDPQATEAFREFDRWTTDQINEANNQNAEELWNRAHLKAIKLAAVCAIGINPLAPLITMNETLWAREIVVEQTNRLIAKFESGLVGQEGGSENKQLRDMIKFISAYMHQPFDSVAKYGVDEQMHATGVITEAVLSRRLGNMAAFKQDRMGPSNAIKRAVKMLIDADELREIPKAQMVATYGRGPRAFVVANAARFAPVRED